MATATCGNCGKVTQLADVMAGRSIRCGQCGATVPVSGSATAAAAPARRAVRNTTGGVAGGGGRLTRGGIGAIIVGCVLAFVGGRELLLGQGASATPRDVTCRELIDHGAGGNAHVRLTDLRLLPAYAYTFERSSPDVWKAAYAPAVPTASYRQFIGRNGRVDVAALKASSDIHVIVQLQDVHNKADAERALTQTSVEGMVMNRISGMSGPATANLRDEYPAMNLDAALLVEQGRTPNASLGVLGLVGGLLVIGLGLWLTFKPES